MKFCKVHLKARSETFFPGNVINELQLRKSTSEGTWASILNLVKKKKYFYLNFQVFFDSLGLSLNLFELILGKLIPKWRGLCEKPHVQSHFSSEFQSK